MKRIIWHWTAGTHTPNASDRKHYHYIIAGDGSVTAGDWPVSANVGPLVSGRYAAHTLNANTGAIGIAVAAMAGAVERPFSAGRYPITPAQVDALAFFTACLCREHGIPVTRQTVLSHAEVQPTLGIAQRGKWDITWLPGMASPGNPVAVGDMLRAKVLDMAAGPPVTAPVAPWWQPVLDWLRNLFRNL